MAMQQHALLMEKPSLFIRQGQAGGVERLGHPLSVQTQSEEWEALLRSLGSVASLLTGGKHPLPSCPC